jgi:hypothetical protein
MKNSLKLLQQWTRNKEAPFLYRRSRYLLLALICVMDPLERFLPLTKLAAMMSVMVMNAHCCLVSV